MLKGRRAHARCSRDLLEVDDGRGFGRRAEVKDAEVASKDKRGDLSLRE
jgi:hypothetical protein